MAVASTTGWAVGREVNLSVDAVGNGSFVVDMAASGAAFLLTPDSFCVSAALVSESAIHETNNFCNVYQGHGTAAGRGSWFEQLVGNTRLEYTQLTSRGCAATTGSNYTGPVGPVLAWPRTGAPQCPQTKLLAAASCYGGHRQQRNHPSWSLDAHRKGGLEVSRRWRLFSFLHVSVNADGDLDGLTEHRSSR